MSVSYTHLDVYKRQEDAPYGGKERVSVRPKQQIIAPTVPRNLKRVAPSANTREKFYGKKNL